MAIMAGVGRGAQAGVLVKNAEALEHLEQVTTLVVDKTGTLTEGKPKLVEVLPADGFDAKEFLRLAASLEQNSEHPLPVAAGVLYPFFGWLLSPIIAGTAMSPSSVSVVSNALRLRKVKL
jgi:Cu+-exporting ATPase